MVSNTIETAAGELGEVGGVLGEVSEVEEIFEATVICQGMHIGIPWPVLSPWEIPLPSSLERLCQSLGSFISDGVAVQKQLVELRLACLAAAACWAKRGKGFKEG